MSTVETMIDANGATLFFDLKHTETNRWCRQYDQFDVAKELIDDAAPSLALSGADVDYRAFEPIVMRCLPVFDRFQI